MQTAKTVATANALERQGCLLEAFQLNLAIAGDVHSVPAIADIAYGNASRIFRRLPEPRQAEFRGALDACVPRSKAIPGNATLTLQSPHSNPTSPGGREADNQRLALQRPPNKREESERLPVQPRRDPGSPVVTVVVPCYNAGKFLDATLHSLQQQTHAALDIILIDDCSADNTLKIARDITKKDDRFRVCQHRANGGLAASRNSGIRLARGEIICFVDADDLLAPNSVAIRLEALMGLRDFDVLAGVYNQSIVIPEDFSGTVDTAFKKPGRDFVDFIRAQGDCPFNAGQPLVRRSVLIEVGGFPESYTQAEDWRLWQKVLRAGYVFLPIPKVGYGYRQTLGSMVLSQPLVHLGVSFENLMRSMRPSGSETDAFEVQYETRYYAAPAFLESAGDLAAMRMFLRRAVNFTGIEYARALDSRTPLTATAAAQNISRLLPGFSALFAGYAINEALRWFTDGVKRYHGVESLSAELETDVRDFALALLAQFGIDDRSLRIGDSPRLIPNRVLERNHDEVVDILFVPHKQYHTRSFELLLPQLRERGLSFAFLDITVPYRDEHARLPSLTDQTFSYNEFAFSRWLPRCIVCMNDWDTVVVRPLIAKANRCGLVTVGIVEGVQDYHDVDTGRKRDPYREVSNVFLTGEFDRRYFAGSKQGLFPVGIQRLDGLAEYTKRRQGRRPGPVPRVLLNVNFSYGVMLERREQWIKDVATACDAAGYSLVISLHPQDDCDLSGYTVDQRPLYELLCEVDFFISRFSGAILEALVIGCPTIYFNGHGERVDKFFDSQGAYQIANDQASLIRCLSLGQTFSDGVAAFLWDHGGFGRGSIAERTAETLQHLIRAQPVEMRQMRSFKASLINLGE